MLCSFSTFFNTGHHALYGGGVLAVASTVTVTATSFASNDAAVGPAIAIGAHSSAVISASQFTHNVITGNDNNETAARVYADVTVISSTADVTSCVFSIPTSYHVSLFASSMALHGVLSSPLSLVLSGRSNVTGDASGTLDVWAR